jgi:hypothetical protein
MILGGVNSSWWLNVNSSLVCASLAIKSKILGRIWWQFWHLVEVEKKAGKFIEGIFGEFRVVLEALNGEDFGCKKFNDSENFNEIIADESWVEVETERFREVLEDFLEFWKENLEFNNLKSRVNACNIALKC